MNEAETRAELIDPWLKACGWGVVEGSKILREFPITAGRIQTGGIRGKKLTADYVLVYKGIKLAVIEAKSDVQEVGEGVAQAKLYAEKLSLETTYATNGREIYSICMKTGMEGLVANYLTPDELWNKTFAVQNHWRDTFAAVLFEDVGGTKTARYYQEIAVNNTMSAIADGKQRILLTLATGTGKTFIAFQIAWKLFQTRWNLTRNIRTSGGLDSARPPENNKTQPGPPEVIRRPRILFLADRNILADQAFNAFSAFPEDALIRIKPNEIRKKGSVPTNGSIFFTIFQTFMSGASTSSAPSELISGSEKIIIKSPFFKELDIKSIPLARGYMYILECADGSFYTGSTKELAWRLEQHQNGEGANHTKQNLPVKLIYYECFDRIDEAYNREKQVQGWSRAKKIALIEGDRDLLLKLSNTNKDPEPVEGYFGEYPPDYFDFIVIDECHRGGANDESNWREIMEYFSPAVQLGLTATPKRKDNVDTYRYFGEPVYIYSLKEGINDGFLTPFKVKRIQTTLDDYTYTSDDQVIEGEIEAGRLYTEPDFNKIIEIKARETKRVQVFLDEANQKEKSLVFCANQAHAALIRDAINQLKKSKDPNYCVRVTANDGEIGEQFLREFQDNEKITPTILTTSQKLSTGVDARNIRNIVLLRPVNQIIEFKQIIGRGTRLFDGKDFFTIYDFVNAYQRFFDPEWDGEPVTDDPCAKCGEIPCICEKTQPRPCPECGQLPCICVKEPPGPCLKCGQSPCVCIKKVRIKLKDGKEREIQHMISTSFWSADGTPISADEFLQSLFGALPEFFKSEEELRTIWSNPLTRKTLLEKLAEAGFGKGELTTLQKLIDAEKSDLYDVLEYVINSDIKPITRTARVAAAQATIFALLNEKQREFIEFVLRKYIETGVEELDQDQLPSLLTNKYQSLPDAGNILGDLTKVKDLFIEFQKYLYEERVA